MELANLIATPIAYLGVASVAVQGVKDAKPEWFNPYGEVLQRQEAKTLIPERSARVFISLSEQGKIPGWVFAFADMRLITLAAS